MLCLCKRFSCCFVHYICMCSSVCQHMHGVEKCEWNDDDKKRVNEFSPNRKSHIHTTANQKRKLLFLSCSNSIRLILVGIWNELCKVWSAHIWCQCYACIHMFAGIICILHIWQYEEQWLKDWTKNFSRAMLNTIHIYHYESIMTLCFSPIWIKNSQHIRMHSFNLHVCILFLIHSSAVIC